MLGLCVPQTYHLLPKDGFRLKTNNGPTSTSPASASLSRCFFESRHRPVESEETNDKGKEEEGTAGSSDDSSTDDEEETEEEEKRLAPIKTGQVDDAIQFILRELREFTSQKGNWYEDDAGFSCRVSFSYQNFTNGSPTMTLYYVSVMPFPRIDAIEGEITIRTYHQNYFQGMDDLIDVLMGCNLEVLNLAGLCDLPHPLVTLPKLGKRLAASTTLKVMRITSLSTEPIACMVATVLKGTKSLQILDIAAKEFAWPSYDEDQEDYGSVAKLLYDGFRYNQSTLRLLKLEVFGPVVILASILGGITENGNDPSLQKLELSVRLPRHESQNVTKIFTGLQQLLEQPGCKLNILTLRKFCMLRDENDNDEEDSTNGDELMLNGGMESLELDVGPIGKALCVNTSLLQLIFKANYLRDDGFDDVATGLQHNSTLHTIKIQGIDFRYYSEEACRPPHGFNKTSSLNPMGWMKLFSGLKRNKGLKVLNIDCNQLDPAAFPSLAEGLGCNTSLEQLIMSRNRYRGGMEHMLCVIDVLVNLNRTLQVLDLSECRGFNEKVVDRLISCLTVNTTLQELILYSCDMSDKQLEKFATNLPKMKGLKSLNILFTILNRNALEAILDAMKNHNFGIVSMKLPMAIYQPSSRGNNSNDSNYQLTSAGQKRLHGQVKLFQRLNQYRSFICNGQSTALLSSSSSSSPPSSSPQQKRRHVPGLLQWAVIEQLEKDMTIGKIDTATVVFCLLRDQLLVPGIVTQHG